jgi:hypothetical protein
MSLEFRPSTLLLPLEETWMQVQEQQFRVTNTLSGGLPQG